MAPYPTWAEPDSGNAFWKGRQSVATFQGMLVHPDQWVPWGTFSSPTSGSPLPCCPGRAVPWLASTACYWAGFACPNHIPIVLRPLSSSNSCPCEHVTNPSCPPLRPLEWGRRNLTTGRNRRRTRGCRSTEVRWLVPDVIHTELTGT